MNALLKLNEMTDASSAPAAPEAHTKETQVPEWEHIAAKGHGEKQAKSSRGYGSKAETLKRKFNTVIPSHRKYLGLRRNVFLVVLLAVFLALLALIIGLAVGLTEKSR